ncbi:MAG: squalene--hopene cyclase [Chloroflexota bacterium]
MAISERTIPLTPAPTRLQPEPDGEPIEALRARASESLRNGMDALLRAQDGEGWWCGELEANVTIQAEYILLMHFLGRRDDTRWQDILHYVDLRQQDDGGWPIYYQGPSDLSTTIEAYAALKLAGRPAEDERMARARAFILSRGGLARSRIFTKIWLALLGEYPWEGTPVMPPELMFLPSWVPLNIYDFSCWARGTIVPLLIVLALRPVRPLPPEARLPELRAGIEAADTRVPRPAPRPSWRLVFWLADRAVRHVRPPRLLRQRAIKAAERWVLNHQERDGSWGGIQPPWVYSLIALSTIGYANDHPAIARSLEGMEAFGVRDEEGWRVQPCVSPIWDTALAVIALLDAGLEAKHPAIVKATGWLLDRQLSGGGDWQVRSPRTPPGGWAFEFFNDGYPDTDDTGIVMLALWKTLNASGGDAPEGASWTSEDVWRGLSLGARWLSGMRSRNGAWASFDVDNSRELVTKIPFADFGETIDPPTEDVTAHVLECLAVVGYPPDHPVLTRATRYLLEQQKADGSWWGRWGVNYIYGIGAVAPALQAVAARGGAQAAAISIALSRAAGWLGLHQRSDGGWGETSASYEDPELRGAGPSTPSQTAWALLGLLAAPGAPEETVARGVRFLVERQRDDGRWDEPEFTGTGFPRAFMINYHLYRQYFPVMALGRYMKRGQGQRR